jgi:hypothetical protein
MTRHLRTEGDLRIVSDLVDHLQRFNRKERFLLVGQALGNPCFMPGDDFRVALGDCLGRTIPENAYCAMDYHLDWLFAALMWTYHAADINTPVEREFTERHPKSGELVDLKVTGNQSDMDLVVAWVDERARGQIVLIEAKGFSPWVPDQMRYKCARLNAIFGSNGRRFEHVDAHLVLTGPPPGPTVKTLPNAQWPVWARQHDTADAPVKYFMPLTKPTYEAVAVERIVTPSEHAPKPSAHGTYWRIKQAKWPSAEQAAPAPT